MFCICFVLHKFVIFCILFICDSDIEDAILSAQEYENISRNPQFSDLKVSSSLDSSIVSHIGQLKFESMNKGLHNKKNSSLDSKEQVSLRRNVGYKQAVQGKGKWKYYLWSFFI